MCYLPSIPSGALWEPSSSQFASRAAGAPAGKKPSALFYQRGPREGRGEEAKQLRQESTPRTTHSQGRTHWSIYQDVRRPKTVTEDTLTAPDHPSPDCPAQTTQPHSCLAPGQAALPAPPPRTSTRPIPDLTTPKGLAALLPRAVSCPEQAGAVLCPGCPQT